MEGIESNLRYIDAQSAVANAVALSKTWGGGDAFYAVAPSVYQPYYMSVMRTSLQFYDGYVPGIHDNSDGIYSTRMAAAICGGLANKTVGADISFRSGSGKENRADLEYVSHIWSKEVGFQTFARNAIEYAYAGGTALIKLNLDSYGRQYPTAVRGDLFVFSEGAKGELLDVRCLVRTYLNTDADNTDGDSYLLIEHRYLKDEIETVYWTNSLGERYAFKTTHRYPYVRYEVVRASPGGTNKTADSVYSATRLEWKSIPYCVQKAINADYGNYVINKEMRLPYKEGYLGAETLKANGYDGNCPNMPFGKPILKDCWVELCEYDIYASFCDKDVNNGQGQVFTPKSYDISDLGQINKTLVDQFGQVIPTADYSRNYRKVVNMQTIDGADPDKVKPFCNQFNLRSEDWERLQDNCLRRMAAKLHMSPKVIASFLGKEMVEKTATEVNSDDDATIEWVKIQRSIFKPKFDRLLEAMLSKEGRIGNVVVRFGSIGAKPRKSKLDELAIMLKYHLTTREEAMREIFEEMDENQLNELIEKSNEEKEKDSVLLPNLEDYGG